MLPLILLGFLQSVHYQSPCPPLHSQNAGQELSCSLLHHQHLRLLGPQTLLNNSE